MGPPRHLSQGPGGRHGAGGGLRVGGWRGALRWWARDDMVRRGWPWRLRRGCRVGWRCPSNPSQPMHRPSNRGQPKRRRRLRRCPSNRGQPRRRRHCSSNPSQPRRRPSNRGQPRRRRRCPSNLGQPMRHRRRPRSPIHPRRRGFMGAPQGWRGG